MLLELLAAAAVGAADAPVPPKTVESVTVTKGAPIVATVKMANDDSAIGQFVNVWPSRAWKAGRAGKVTLSCLIDVHGLAEWCKVARETPENRGFGDAALQLRPMLKLPPAMGPDGPREAVMDIAIDFTPPDLQYAFDYNRAKDAHGEVQADAFKYYGNPLPSTPVTMLTNPVWAAAPSFDDLARSYPARGAGVEGYAVAHCRVQRTGALSHCMSVKEEPSGRGFGGAGLALAAKFRVTPELARQRHRDPLWVDIPMRMPAPGRAERVVKAPLWLTTLAAAPKIFPPEAAARGVTSGRSVVRCTVDAEGALTNCAPEAGEPAGLGFAEAAAKLASSLRMNLWSADAAPVVGGVVHIPVRLNLASAN